MYTKLTIPERLKDLRVMDKHLTLEQLAEQTGLSKSALGKYESDDYKDISPFAIATLAEFYGVSTDYLMGLTDNKEVPNANVQSLHLNDEMIELLRSGKINNRLLCELATHPNFRRLMVDMEICIDRIANMRVEQMNLVMEATRQTVLSKYAPGEDDLYVRTLELGQVQESDFYSHVMHDDLDNIVQDIREAHLKDKTTALKKRGRMLRASYEAIKFQRLDLFTLALRRIGAEIARCQMKDAVDVLVNGDGSTGSAPQKLATAATTLAYSDLLTLWSNFTAYQMNTLLVNAKTAAAILGLSAFSDPTTGLHFQNTGKLGTPLGAEMIHCDAVADGTIIALDRRYALEMVVGDAVTVDADRLIDCQLERAAVSSTAGFSMIFPDAVKVMTLKTA